MNLARDLRYALRMMAKAPGFSALAILTLALGIGANVAIFSVANAVLLRPLPYAEPDQLVRISTHRDASCCISFPYYKLLAQTGQSFDGVAAHSFDTLNLETAAGAEQVDAERVSGNFFDVLGAKPLAGRIFTPEEDKPGGNLVALVGYELATRLFGGERAALGQQLPLDGKDYSVIGVLPPKFGVPLLGRQPEVWLPRLMELTTVTPARIAIGGPYYDALARLRPGVTVAAARAEAEVVFERYKHDKPRNYDATTPVVIVVRDLHGVLVADVRPMVLILSAAVGFVLLIACANVAGLLLFRALGRRKEFAVRSALGAPRAVLVRQLLIESVTMSVLSGALGILLGQMGTFLLAKFTQDNLPQLADVAVDARVLVFTFAIAVLSGILFGLAPALQLSRSDVNASLSEEGRGAAGSRTRNRARTVIITGQIAMCMVLLIGAGLLIRSFARLRNVEPGFNAMNTLTAQTFLPPAVYPAPADRAAFCRDALAKLREIPGVKAASVSGALPVLMNHLTPARFEGEPEVELGQRSIVAIQAVSADYPAAIGVPLVAGRAFTEEDDAQAAQVVMVNQAAARRYWPGQDPVGKLVWVGLLPPSRVVGVLADVKNESLAAPTQPEVFLSYAQSPAPNIYFTLRTGTEPHALASALRAQIAAVNRGQPITDVRTMEERLAMSSAQTRSMMILIGVFSATALILAIVGIYGVIAYSVAQRTQELSIRMALGASQADIFRLIIGNGLRLAWMGIGIGLLAAFALTRLMKSVLFETSASDPLTFVWCALLFAAVAAVANYLPARRATRIDPTEALRGA